MYICLGGCYCRSGCRIVLGVPPTMVICAALPLFRMGCSCVHSSAIRPVGTTSILAFACRWPVLFGWLHLLCFEEGSLHAFHFSCMDCGRVCLSILVHCSLCFVALHFAEQRFINGFSFYSKWGVSKESKRMLG